MADELERETLDEMTDEELLKRLLGADTKPPEAKFRIKRLGIVVTLKALRDDEIEAIQEQCTHTMRDRRGRVTREFDSQKFARRLIVAASVKPNWGAPELMRKFEASTPDQVVRRLLLAGEIDMLSDAILDLSGYEEGIEELKNS